MKYFFFLLVLTVSLVDGKGLFSHITTEFLQVELAKRFRQKYENLPVAFIATDSGVLAFVLHKDDAPATVKNFIALANSHKFYDKDATFYRYEKNFVLQGGNFDGPSNMSVPLEYKLNNDLYTVGLARTEDINSGSSEFYINLKNNTDSLKPIPGRSAGYAVFGTIVAGFEVIDAIIKHPVEKHDGIHFFKKPMPRIISIRVLDPE